MKNHFSEVDWVLVLTSILIGIIFLGICSYFVEPCKNPTDACDGRFWGDLFFDRSVDYNAVNPSNLEESRKSIYPFTIQNLMWILFFIGLGDVWLRLRQGKSELAQLDKNILPEDEKTMLRKEDLSEVYKRMKQLKGNNYFLQRLVARGILQFQSGRSVDRVNTVFNSTLDLLSHEIEIKYNLLRYIVWLIPTLGFIGTVIGIAMSLQVAGNVPDIMEGQAIVGPWMKQLTASLGVAFYTTLLALLMSAILVFLLHIAQGREEKVLNYVGQYTLDNLINRLYEH
ncbi:MotA/TolQ/ExbB proton channel family protein [Microbulbifer epialgicus]|uniref:MotA/TolQ/ExbB proton channel family protein n=1 Tax=Microbulbifer epialgicus TaxID=393907 RepID=A0ABV4NVJ2_9GAMM